jgi:hypothetical protein
MGDKTSYRRLNPKKRDPLAEEEDERQVHRLARIKKKDRREDDDEDYS